METTSASSNNDDLVPASSTAIYKVARLISNLISPPLIALAAVLISIYVPPNQGLTLPGWLFILIAILPPILYVVQLVRSGAVTDFHLPSRSERFGPFLATLVAGIMGWLIVLWLDSPHPLRLIALINVVQTAMLMLISHCWKISIHATAITGLAVVAIYLVGNVAWPLVLLIPLVGWSRVFLKRHTLEQVIGGTILGFVVVLAAINFYG